MTTDELAAAFAEFHDEHFSEFGNLPEEKELDIRPDLYAFNLLHTLVPGTNDMISAAEHDEIYLSVDIDRLADMATKDDIRMLVRCGVRLHTEYDCLAMFV